MMEERMMNEKDMKSLSDENLEGVTGGAYLINMEGSNTLPPELLRAEQLEKIAIKYKEMLASEKGVK